MSKVIYACLACKIHMPTHRRGIEYVCNCGRKMKRMTYEAFDKYLAAQQPLEVQKRVISAHNGAQTQWRTKRTK
jgi:hypothetical protein